MKAFFHKYKSALLAALLIAFLYLVLFAVGITCPIKHVLGISCPGCGMSRALFYLLTFRPATALSYHPLVFLLIPFVAVCTVLAVKQRKKAFRALLLAGAVCLLTVWLYRMLVLDTDVVVFQPQNGLIGQWVMRLLHWFS